MRRVLEQIEAHFAEREVTGRGITVAVLDSGERVIIMSS